eukprot:jgi/Tetstr1/454055/TSEL_040974.t1
MRVLSIDVGVKNLGVCELEAGGDAGLSIGFWGVVSGSSQDDRAIQTAIAGAVEVMTELHERSGGAGWDCVVIENQPCIKNPRMKAVQIAIHTFLVTQYGPDVSVCLAGAVGKNKVADRILRPAGQAAEPAATETEAEAAAPAPAPAPAPATPGQRYRRAKQRCVAAARVFLQSRPGLAGHVAQLDACAKKDDMCDALLQGLYYLTEKAKNLTL